MEIVFHSHHARVSDRILRRAELGVTKLARRLRRATMVVVRFEEDGPAHRVEITLHAARRRLVAEGTGRYFGPALAAALAHLTVRADRVRKAKQKGGRTANRSADGRD